MMAGWVLLALAAGLAAPQGWPALGGFGESTVSGGMVVAEAGAGRQGIPNGLEGGVAWINTAGPIHLEDLRGKVVLLDFWTYCCINCHHVLPDLEYLEGRYPNELVVIGVHTAKFDAEKETDNIRKKVAEYRIKHPVVNDANQVIWNRFGVNSWPTMVVISPEGEYVGSAPGEGNREVLDRVIGKLVEEAKAKGTLNTETIRFNPEMEKPHTSPLLFPGKVTGDADGKRLFITDTGHNRIVVTDLEGKHIATVGSGAAGFKDGSFSEAEFNRPQGARLFEGKLYVADTENHAIREVDLEKGSVTTVAGTGNQSMRRTSGGKALETPLNSPWDVLPLPGTRTLAIAMAGPHQLWKLDLASGEVRVWAGNGKEDIVDGPLGTSSFAQPSGLATDGNFVYVADSEGSAIRAVSLGRNPRVATVAGTHDLPLGQSLFAFGDRDGRGGNALFQHCLAVDEADGTLYVADTYNNKIKAIDLESQVSETLVGTRSGGSTDNPPQFDEPGGLSVVGSSIYIADTNNHAIRVINRADKTVKTLELSGIEGPKPARSKPKFTNPIVIKLGDKTVAVGPRFTLAVKLVLPEGFELNPDAPMPVLLEAPGSRGMLGSEVTEYGSMVEPPRTEFEVEVPLARTPRAGNSLGLKLSASVFECKKGGAGYCRVRNFVWEIPVTFGAGGTSRVEISNVKPEREAAPR
jgi:sugar lactone lactonase YvrE